MKLLLKNCNNIDRGQIEIVPGRLNIKYAINGTGKSTLARAILLNTKAETDSGEHLNELMPFKYRKAGDNTPEISGLEQIRSVRAFNDDYVNEFVFKPDELVKGSFDIFIKSKEYEEGLAQIEKLVSDLRATLAADNDVAALLLDFQELSDSFGKPVKSGLHGSSGLAKAFKGGNPVANIPAGLEPYKSFIQHQNSYKWIRWQHEGKEYWDIHDGCPYCVTDITAKKIIIEKISQAYEPKSIETLNKIVSAFERLSKYFSESTRLTIDKFVRNTQKYTDDEANFLSTVKQNLDGLRSNFVRVQNLGFNSLKDVKKVVDALKSYKIDLALFPHLQSEETTKKVEIVNNALNLLLDQAGQLQGTIAKHKDHISRLVKEHSEGINGFLANAGYKYVVDLEDDDKGSYKLKLRHVDSEEVISSARNHLSFGERNAIALVLFMFDAIKNAADLIVLDDPISSFDKNKKYAIVDMLFRRKNSFRGKTVLLLTHDLDPAVDMVIHHSDRFDAPLVHFLENKHGQLEEIEITRTDIQTFMEITRHNIAHSDHALNKLVYLRRLLEIENDKGEEFDLLSNLFHKRIKPTKRANGVEREMTKEEIAAAQNSIKAHIADFDYDVLLGIVKSDGQMTDIYSKTSSNYEKIHIYRIIFDGRPANGIESPVILKFINEAFHIENNYIYQINPRKYQLVPQFVIDECDRYVAAI